MLFFFDQSPAQFSLANVFRAYGPGSWLEPRIGQMWQENIGTNPTVSAGQTIGLILSQDQLQQLGPERVTNGSFTNGLTGWTDTSTPPGSVTISNGTAILTTMSGGSVRLRSVAAPVTAGRFYKFSYSRTITAGSGSALQTSVGTTVGGFDLAAFGSSSEGIFLATTANAYISIFTGGGFTAIVDDFSIKEIMGNHASQTTAANRPTLQYTNGLPLVRCDSNDFMTIYFPDLGGGVFSSAGSVYFALSTGMSALHDQSIGTSYSAPIQNMDLYGVYIFSNRLPTAIETQLQSYCKRLAGI